MHFAIDALGDGLRARHLELDSLAAHLFYKDGEVKLAAPAHEKLVCGIGAFPRGAPRLSAAHAGAGPRSIRDDAYLPSCPENGDVLTLNVMRTVGSSTFMRSRESGASGDATVSPIRTPLKPGERDDLAGGGRFDLVAREVAERE